jgi:hypothetical protein
MWQMPPGSPPATFSRRLLRKQHTDADRLAFREFSGAARPSGVVAFLWPRQRRSFCATQQEAHEKKRFYKPFVVSAAKAALFAGTGIGRDEITHTERKQPAGRRISPVIVMPAHLC